MAMSAIAPISLFQNGVQSPNTQSPANSGSFSTDLMNALDKVNSLSQQADNMSASYAAGGPVTLDQLMVAEQQASLSLDMVVQVRDKVVSAYQTIMNMQV